MTNKVFQHSLHRELWQWLAENPEMDKKDWVQWKVNGGTVNIARSYCFACEYTLEFGVTHCGICPIQWDCGGCYGSDNVYSEYERWMDAESKEERTRLALLIKDLPVKDGVVTE